MNMRLLVLSSLVALLAACGGGEGGNSATPANAQSNASRANALSTASSSEQLPSVIQVAKVSESRVGRTTFDYVFKVTVTGGSIDYEQATARVVRVGAGTSVVDGSVVIGNVSASASVQLDDTITLRHDRSVPFDPSAISWSVTAVAVARSVQITPNAVTFTGAAQAQPITVRVLNSAGREIPGAPFALTSSNPDQVAVSQDGLVRSMSTLGSAVIVATSGALVSNPASATIIGTLPNTAMVRDDQVLIGPALIAGETGNVGSKHKITVRSDLPLEIGQIILGSGGQPIAGKILSIQRDPQNASLVTYETLPLTQLVRDLSVSLSFPPTQGDTVVGSNSRILTEKRTKRTLGMRPQFITKIKGFECESNAGFINSLDLNADLKTFLTKIYEVSVVSGAMQGARIGAFGSIDYSVTGELKLGQLAGGVECTKNIAQVPIPITGFLKALVVPSVPIDVVLSAKASAGSALRWRIEASRRATATLGIKFLPSTGWEAMADFDTDSSASGNLLPEVGSLDLDIAAGIGLGSGLSIYSEVGDKELTVLSLTGLLQYNWKGGLPNTVALDDTFNAEDSTQFVLEVGPGDHLSKFINWFAPTSLNVNISVSRTHTIDTSPQLEAARADQSVYRSGQTVKFNVKLKPESLNTGPLGVFGYNVDEVRIYRLDRSLLTSGSAALVAAVKPSASGQSEFQLDWIANTDGSISDSNGKANFYAFVVTKRFKSLRETFPVELGQVAALPTGSRITDTGIALCYQVGSNILVSCASAAAVSLNPYQDGMLGRDVTEPENLDGRLGFSYAKIATDGSELPVSATTWSCVKDKITGLMWENKGAVNSAITYTNWGDGRAGDASRFLAESQGLCGYSDWRLPTAEELHSLVDYGGVNIAGVAIDQNFFQHSARAPTWSSSTVAGYPVLAWIVAFAGAEGSSLGDVNLRRRDYAGSVLLVRAASSQAAVFALSADGNEVTDTSTGLTWRRCPEGMVFAGGTCAGTATRFTHEQALQRAASHSAGGWRLPNAKELASIVDRGRMNPSIDSVAFPATPLAWFWSSSPEVYSAGAARFVDFTSGYVSITDRSPNSAHHVRLVRSNQ